MEAHKIETSVLLEILGREESFRLSSRPLPKERRTSLIAYFGERNWLGVAQQPPPSPGFSFCQPSVPAGQACSFLLWESHRAGGMSASGKLAVWAGVGEVGSLTGTSALAALFEPALLAIKLIDWSLCDSCIHFAVKFWTWKGGRWRKFPWRNSSSSILIPWLLILVPPPRPPSTQHPPLALLTCVMVPSMSRPITCPCIRLLARPPVLLWALSTMTAHWVLESPSHYWPHTLFCPSSLLFLTLPLQFSWSHGPVNYQRWIWFSQESGELKIEKSPSQQEQSAQPQRYVLRHAQRFHLGIPSSVPWQTELPVSCKLAEPCSLAWSLHLQEKARVIALSLYFSLGRAPCGPCPQTTSWCPPGSLCGSMLIPAPGFRGKADPMPFLSCTAAGFLSQLFCGATAWYISKCVSCPSPIPAPYSCSTPTACAMYSHWPSQQRQGVSSIGADMSQHHPEKQVLLFSTQSCSVPCSFPSLPRHLPYCRVHTRISGGSHTGCGSMLCLPFYWVLCPKYLPHPYPREMDSENREPLI